MKNILKKIKFLRKLKKYLHTIWVQTSQYYYALVGSTVECNICHYQAMKLDSNEWHRYTICPNCGSHVGNRLLVATFEYSENFNFGKLIVGKSILHFAPEEAVGKLIKLCAKNYETADLLAEGYFYETIDYNVDISNMANIQDESFDFVIACEVLEHVNNHINGIKEVHRILKKGGYCIFTVPQRDNLEITFEDKSIVTSFDRKRAYGQSDHLRIYGADFKYIVENCGFSVTEISAEHFPKRIVERYVLSPPILSSKTNATNFKKLYFGLK